MKQGKVVEEFSVKDKNGNKIHVSFHYPKESDVKQALKLVNEVRDEAEFLGNRKHETPESETKFIKQKILENESGKGIFLFIEADGKLIGDVSLQPNEYDVSSHVGKLGIMIREEFTEIGIGTKAVAKLIELAKDTDFKIIESGYFKLNKRSERLHKKFGFKKYGEFPSECKLRSGEYCPHIYLYKQIKKL